MIAPEVYHDEFGEYHEYIRVNHEYSGGVQYTGDIMSTPEAYHDECGEYHEYTGGLS